MNDLLRVGSRCDGDDLFNDLGVVCIASSRAAALSLGKERTRYVIKTCFFLIP